MEATPLMPFPQPEEIITEVEEEAEGSTLATNKANQANNNIRASKPKGGLNEEAEEEDSQQEEYEEEEFYEEISEPISAIYSRRQTQSKN